MLLTIAYLVLFGSEYFTWFTIFWRRNYFLLFTVRILLLQKNLSFTGAKNTELRLLLWLCDIFCFLLWSFTSSSVLKPVTFKIEGYHSAHYTNLKVNNIAFLNVLRVSFILPERFEVSTVLCLGTTKPLPLQKWG